VNSIKDCFDAGDLMRSSTCAVAGESSSASFPRKEGESIPERPNDGDCDMVASVAERQMSAWRRDNAQDSKEHRTCLGCMRQQVNNYLVLTNGVLGAISTIVRCRGESRGDTIVHGDPSPTCAGDNRRFASAGSTLASLGNLGGGGRGLVVTWTADRYAIVLARPPNGSGSQCTCAMSH